MSLIAIYLGFSNCTSSRNFKGSVYEYTSCRTEFNNNNAEFGLYSILPIFLFSTKSVIVQNISNHLSCASWKNE
ncbi:hypothetical protein J5751_04465 [bacterium]|nr:hypothetical protein [bacterium]